MGREGISDTSSNIINTHRRPFCVRGGRVSKVLEVNARMHQREVFVHRHYTKARGREKLRPFWRSIDEAFKQFCQDPSTPSLRFERLDHEELWWSYRVNDDIRTIVSDAEDCWILCYVDHHDDAYRWASRRRPILDRTTGVHAFIPRELEQETQQILSKPDYVPAPSRPLSGYTVQQIERLGVPSKELVQQLIMADADAIEILLFHALDEGWLPEEVVERIDLLARGVRPYRELLPPDISVLLPSELMRAKPREFWSPKSIEEIDKMIGKPWDEWVIYLHPSQKRAVEIEAAAPVRITGGAGTGKTVVAVHRTYNTAINHSGSEPPKILLTTFTGVLTENLERLLCHPKLFGNKDTLEEFGVEVATLHSVAKRLYYASLGQELTPEGIHTVMQTNIAKEEKIREIIRNCASMETGLNDDFLWMEWNRIIDAWNVRTLEQYLAIERIGRRAPLQPSQRERLWPIFQTVWEFLENQGYLTFNQMCYKAAEFVNQHPELKYRYVIVDEAQDFGPAELTLIRALASEKPNGLFICADTRQRIYRPAVPWARFGIDTRGRSYILRVNYRTTRQIQQFAEKVLPSMIEGVQEDEPEILRERPYPILSGPEPECCGYESIEAERRGLKEWVYRCLHENINPGEIAIFARSRQAVSDRIEPALRQIEKEKGILSQEITRETPIQPTKLNYGTAHSAKGLEFRAVALVGAAQGLFPVYSALASTEDWREKQEAADQERQLFYTVCTRAREKLYISWSPTDQRTRFLDFLDSR